MNALTSLASLIPAGVLPGNMSPATFLALAIAALAALGALAVGYALLTADRTGVGLGTEIVAADTYAGVAGVQELRDPVTGLRGKPDYIVRRRSWWFGALKLVPMELKPNRRSKTLYDGDRLQVGVYLILLRARYGREAANYGLVRYRDAHFRVTLTKALEREVLRAADGVRQARQAVPGRSHRERGRCARCGVRPWCDEALT